MITIGKTTGIGFLLSLCLLLTACSSAKDPSSITEYAIQGLYSASLSSNGRLAIVGSINHGGSLWDTTRNERLYDWNHKKGSYSNLVASAFSPEQDYAVTADQQTLVLWDVHTGKPVWFWDAPAGILDVALTANGKLALLGLANHTAVYFDVQNGGVKQQLYHQARVTSVATSDDGRYAVTGSDDYRATFWDVQAGKALQTMTHDNRVDTVALSPNGNIIFSAGELGKAILWDSSTGKVLHTLTGDEPFIQQRHSYTCAVFSANSDQLLTGNSAGLVQLWDVREGKELQRWKLHRRDPLRPTSVYVMAVAFSDTSGYRAIASNGYINELN